MGIELKEFADVYDLDGTLLDRGLIITALSDLKNRIPFRKPPFIISVEELPAFNHNRVEGEISGIREGLSFWAHMRRTAIPRMKTMLAQSFEEGADVYILTGRSSSGTWYDGTIDQLDREQMRRYVWNFDRRLHTPGGKHTAKSKVHGLYVISQRYKGTRMTDDDLPTVLLGATVLPEVFFRYVFHGGLAIYPSQRELTSHSNISVIDLTTHR